MTTRRPYTSYSSPKNSKRRKTIKRRNTISDFKLSPLKSYSLTQYEKEDECPICLEYYTSKNPPCLLYHAVETGNDIPHKFHERCIQKNRRYNNKCPKCRQEISHLECRGNIKSPLILPNQEIQRIIDNERRRPRQYTQEVIQLAMEYKEYISQFVNYHPHRYIFRIINPNGGDFIYNEQTGNYVLNESVNDDNYMEFYKHNLNHYIGRVTITYTTHYDGQHGVYINGPIDYVDARIDNIIFSNNPLDGESIKNHIIIMYGMHDNNDITEYFSHLLEGNTLGLNMIYLRFYVAPRELVRYHNRISTFGRTLTNTGMHISRSIRNTGNTIRNTASHLSRTNRNVSQ